MQSLRFAIVVAYYRSNLELESSLCGFTLLIASKYIRFK
jgi:hypothetical protein